MPKSFLHVYTSTYRYPMGADRLDITVKGQDPIGKHFAPTWELVRRFKDKQHPLDEESYTREYRKLMRRSYVEHRHIWDELLARDRVVLVCFCRPGAFCHRLLLAGFLEQCGAKYEGEI